MKEYKLVFSIYDEVHKKIVTEIADVKAFSYPDAIVRYSKYLPSYAYIMSAHEREV
jgi:hypothetical protein